MGIRTIDPTSETGVAVHTPVMVAVAVLATFCASAAIPIMDSYVTFERHCFSLMWFVKRI